MAVDIDDMMSEAISVVETALRTSLADKLVEVLGSVADGVEGDYNEDWATEHADGQVDTDDEETVRTSVEVHELLVAAFAAGYEKGVEYFRAGIESAKYTGWRPRIAEATDSE